MGLETISTAVTLLWAIFGSQELTFINQLNTVYNFDHNIFVVHSSVDIYRFVGATIEDQENQTTPRCLFIFDDEDDLTTATIFENRTGKSELLIVVPESSNFERIINLLSFVKRIQVSNVNLKIGFFLPDTASTDDLRVMFDWCWKHRIINIFAAFGEPSLNVFNFNPFDTLINVTGSESLQKIFPEKISNFQQHQFRLAAVDDASISQYSNSIFFANGPDEKLWRAVFSVINATYSVFFVKDSLDPIDTLDNGTVDIHGDLTDLLNHRTVTIYPMIMEIISVVVPKTKPFSAFEAFMKIATSSHIFGYSLTIIVVAVVVLMCSRYVNYKKCFIFECVADVMNLLLNENSAIKYRRLSLSENCLVVPLTFVGFIITNGFLSSLQSHLTRPIMQPQIETIEDFYRSTFPITSPNEYWLMKDVETLNGLLKMKGDFSSRMRTIEYPDFLQNVFSGVPFAFGEYNSFAKAICKYRNYHLTPIQLQRVWYAHNVRSDFPFTDRVNDLIQRIITAGLYSKWWDDAIIDDKVFRTVEAETNIDRFSAPIFVVYGWIAGCVVFIVEVNWKKIRMKKTVVV